MANVGLGAAGASYSGGSGRRTVQMNSLGISTAKKTAAAVSTPPASKPSGGSSTTGGSKAARQPAKFFEAQSSEGTAVPWICGTVRIAEPNITWVGNQASETISYESLEGSTDGQPVTKTSGVIDTVDIQYGLCTGGETGVKLLAIYDDSTPLWTGSVGPARATFSPAAATGIFAGSCIFYGGLFTQTPPPEIVASMPGEDVPGFVGVAYLFVQNGDRSGNVGNLTFEVQRVPNPLGLSSGLNVNADGDVNPMTLLISGLTEKFNAADISLASFDVDALEIVAATLADEGNFVSTMITDDGVTPADFIVQIESQVDGVFFQDPTTGLFTFRLFRTEDVDLEDPSILLLDEEAYEGTPDFNKIGWEGSVNRVRVGYSERDEGYGTVTVTAQTIEVTANGGRTKRDRYVSFPMTCNKDLAIDLAIRELNLSAIPRYSARVSTDRRAAELLPADVVLLSCSLYNLSRVPFFVTRRREQPNDSNKVILELSQFEFPPNNIDIPPPEDNASPTQPGQSYSSTPPTRGRVIDAPYPWMFIKNSAGVAIRIGGNRITDPIISPHGDQTVPLVLGEGSVSNQYRLAVTRPSDGVAYQEGTRAFRTGRLVTPISKYDNFSTGVLANIDFNNLTPAQFAFGTTFLVLINDELFQTVPLNFLNPNYRAASLYRSMLDTVPQDHDAGDLVWFIELNPQSPPIVQPFDPGISPTTQFKVHGVNYANGKLLPKSTGFITLDYDPELRGVRPLRPHLTTINGVRSSTPQALTIGGTKTITWKIRARWQPVNPLSGNGLPSASQASWYDWSSGDISFLTTSEASQRSEYDLANDKYVQYRVMVEDSAGTVHNCGNTADNLNDEDSLLITVPGIAAAGAGWLWVEAYNDYNDSSLWQDRLPVTLS